MTALSELEPHLPAPLVFSPSDDLPGWVAIQNPDGTHVASVEPEAGVLHVDVTLFSGPKSEHDADAIEDLRAQYEEAFTTVLLPVWKAAGFALDEVEECAASSSDWWIVLARLQVQWPGPEAFAARLAFARAEAERAEELGVV